MRLRRHVVVPILVVALTAGLPATAAAAALPAAHVWVTTPDGAMKMSDRNPDGSTALVVHNENDDPRSFAVAQGGALTTIDVPATAARFLRVVQTATAPQWWSVADLRVYR